MKTTFDQLRDTQPQFFSAAAIAIPAAAMQGERDHTGPDDRGSGSDVLAHFHVFLSLRGRRGVLGRFLVGVLVWRTRGRGRWIVSPSKDARHLDDATPVG